MKSDYIDGEKINREFIGDMRDRICLCKSAWSYSEAELKKGRCAKCNGVCFPNGKEIER